MAQNHLRLARVGLHSDDRLLAKNCFPIGYRCGGHQSDRRGQCVQNFNAKMAIFEFSCHLSPRPSFFLSPTTRTLKPCACETAFRASLRTDDMSTLQSYGRTNPYGSVSFYGIVRAFSGVPMESNEGLYADLGGNAIEQVMHAIISKIILIWGGSN